MTVRPPQVPFKPSGFRLAYHRGTTNHCPGCGHSHWIVGRSSAQCGYCDTAIPFAEPFRYAA